MRAYMAAALYGLHAVEMAQKRTGPWSSDINCKKLADKSLDLISDYKPAPFINVI